MAGVVLLAEDDEDSRDLVSFLLQRSGVPVQLLVAENGKEAVDLARDKQPSLILMDMQMPVMDGWTAVSRLKEDERTRDIPVIALTAHAGNEDAERARNIGCVAHCTKPIDPDGLMKLVRQYIQE